MNRKNVLAILGSPHTNGTTAAMLDLAIHKAKQVGYVVTKINLYEKELSFCTGCRACMDTHICVQKDDIQSIVVLLQKCHLVILAALSIGQMCQLLSKTYLTDCWSCYGRNRHISQTTFAGKAIYTFNFL